MCSGAPCQASPGAPRHLLSGHRRAGSRRSSPRTPDAATGRNQRPHPTSTPTPTACPAASPAARGTRPIFLLPEPARRVRAECDLQTEAGSGRGSVASPGSEGGGPTWLASPLPLTPSVAVAASAAVRTDEGSEKQSFSTPASSRGANNFFRRHSPVRWFHLWSAPFPPDCCQGGLAHH